MEFLESVEEGMQKAQELIQNTAGDELDPQGEQDKDECEAEGVRDHPDFVFSDPGNFDKEVESASTGLFKTVTLIPEIELDQLTYAPGKEALSSISQVAYTPIISSDARVLDFLERTIWRL